MAPTTSITRWSMYCKALKHHVDTLPDIADTLPGGEESLTREDDRKKKTAIANAKAKEQVVTECRLRRNGEVMQAREREMSWSARERERQYSIATLTPFVTSICDLSLLK